MPADPWWTDPANVNQLCHWLIGKHLIESAQDCQGVHDQPWKWTLEHGDMQVDEIRSRDRRIWVAA